MSAHRFSFPAIDGGTVTLADFRGKPVLIVNTASECGYTPQYAALQQLWQRYRDRGLAVLGVPANDFGAQEPGDEPAIASFCQTNYGVDFPLTAKQTVIGGAAFLIAADLVARTVLAPQELPVGVVTALAGAPFFIFVLRRLKRDRRTASIPVLVVSSHSHYEQEARQLGAAGYLTKPVRTSDLFRTVAAQFMDRAARPAGRSR